MSKKPVQLRTPLGEEVLQLKAGDHVELSGIVYTARDEAHLRMQEKGIPVRSRRVRSSTTAVRSSRTRRSSPPARRPPPG